jgi:hypothetical protein
MTKMRKDLDELYVSISLVYQGKVQCRDITMAEVAANVAMKMVYQVIFERIRLKTIESIESGDVALDELKDQLSTGKLPLP